MSPKQLQEYRLLQEEFENDCQRVAKILEGLERYKGMEGRDIRYAESFVINGDNIDWSGEETWRYGGYEMHSGSFPVAYLFMTDDELKEIVDLANEEYRMKQEENARLEQEKQKAKRMEEYEKLKKEFEGQ